jgi:hypothetical protein
MGNLFKNKLVFSAVGVVVILVGVIVYVFFPKQDSTSSFPSESAQNIKKLSADDIGLILTPTKGGKAITMEITKLDGISSIEYDVSYDARVADEGEEIVVPRGVAGSAIQIKPGETSVSRDLDLGTCSKNVCKYDQVESDVTFVIRVNFTNGEVGAVEAKITLSDLTS